MEQVDTNPKQPRTGERLQPNLFISGILPSLTRRQILDYLTWFDQVEFFNMPIDPMTQAWKGFAKVRLHSEDGIELILSRSEHWIGQCKVVISPWVDQEQNLSSKDAINRKKVFIRFKPMMKEEELIEHFSRFGTINVIDCKRDLNNNKPRNFAYILFDTEEPGSHPTRVSEIETAENLVRVDDSQISYEETRESIEIDVCTGDSTRSFTGFIS